MLVVGGMPGVDENLTNWSADWDWSKRGDEWSRWWGGTPAMWHAAILPRIHAFVPAPAILEIAPGYGRWTQYLKDLAERLVIVDLTEECIDGCRERFADSTNIEYHVNDGRSLAMVEDRSIDFAFSFDSLVHAEDDVLAAYLAELSKKLKPDGIGFIHHSNIGRYPTALRLARRAPNRLLGPLMHRGLLINLPAWRAESVTAELFAQRCEQAGLACIAQELISWEFGRYVIDAISIFTPHGSAWERPRATARNPGFTAEARRTARLYAAPAPGEGRA